MIIPCFFLPLIGKIIDFTGNYLLWLSSACLVELLCMILLIFAKPEILLIFVGIGICIKTCILFPVLSQMIQTEHQGKALSIIKSLKDLIGFFVILGISKIGALYQSNIIYMPIFVGLTLIILVFAVVLQVKLKISSKKSKGALFAHHQKELKA